MVIWRLPSGDIDAQELRANSITVCGSVRDKLHIEERLAIQSGGRVSGATKDATPPAFATEATV